MNNGHRPYDDVIDAPLRNVPFTLVGILRKTGQIYYYEWETEPGPEEYLTGGTAILSRIQSEHGRHRKPDKWIFCPSAQVDWDRINDTVRSKPVLCS